MVASVCGFGVGAHADIASKSYVDSNQSDWAQADASAPDYIKNKPNIWVDGDLKDAETGDLVDVTTIRNFVEMRDDKKVSKYQQDAVDNSVMMVDKYHQVIPALITNDNISDNAGITSDKLDIADEMVWDEGTQSYVGNAMVISTGGGLARGQVRFYDIADGAVAFQKLRMRKQGEEVNDGQDVALKVDSRGQIFTGKIDSTDIADGAVTHEKLGQGLVQRTYPDGLTANLVTGVTQNADGTINVETTTVDAHLIYDDYLVPLDTYKADKTDARFDTVSTTMPTGTPPTGHVFMWIE